MTTITMEQVAARVPAELPDDELPEGWVLWTPGRRRTGELRDAELIDVDEEPEDRSRIHMASVDQWHRSILRRDLEAAARAYVELWRADDPRTVEVGRQLPTAWRARALSTLGYSALGHAELLGMTTVPGVESDIRQHATSQEEPDRGIWPHVPWQRDPDRWTIYAPSVARPAWAWPDVIVRSDRIARAAAGTPIPDGWETVDDPEPRAPWSITWSTWQDTRVWEHAGWGWWPTELTMVVVRPRPAGSWLAQVGTGGHARIVGERPTQAEATELATAYLRERRAAEAAWLVSVGWPAERISWPEPRVEVGSPTAG